MYPFLRMAWHLGRAARSPRLGLTEAHVSRHICWPWDLDLWAELNNGRTLTMYDLGRIPLARRTGLEAVLRRHRWGLAVAGVSVRYRRRVQAFQRLTMRSRCLGWDERFFYIDQSLWRGDDCANQMLLRAAITDAGGIVAPARVLAAADEPTASPPLPDWVLAWATAEGQRPWPPER